MLLAKSIGFIGLGNLGLPMVASLTSRSWCVVVHDPDTERTAKAREAGGEPADEVLALEEACDTIVHVGPPGAGAAVKLANQPMLFSSLGGAYDAMSLAQAYGVDEDRVLSAIGTGTGASWASDNWGF